MGLVLSNIKDCILSPIACPYKSLNVIPVLGVLTTNTFNVPITVLPSLRFNFTSYGIT
nr:MAG TPA: hypothetical protein [Caudoviricetes sp.]